MNRSTKEAGARLRDLDLDELLHPAQAFSHPSEVVADLDLTLNEKRAILASWASDACAVESAPTLRDLGPGRPHVGFDEVMEVEVLRTLDRQACVDSARYRVPLRPSFGLVSAKSGPSPVSTELAPRFAFRCRFDLATNRGSPRYNHNG